MKILAINGSHKGKKGYTHFLIEKLFTGARSQNAECEEIALAEININTCKGCNVCGTEEHLLKCIYNEKDDIAGVFDKMREADIIVYATPIYIFNMSGLMKVFLDRINSTGNCTDFRLSEKGLVFHHITKEIYSKPFVTLICCNSFEKENTISVTSYFRTFSRFMDAPQVGTIIRNSGVVTGYGKDPEKEKLFPKILESYKAFETAGKELATIGQIARRTEKKTNQDIFPIPMFNTLKHLKGFKKKFIARVNNEIALLS
jgi:multimeric flavodoxin WrbA